MLSKKYFLGGGRNFSAPPAHPTHAEVRDHIGPQESDHRASYRAYRRLQQQGQLKTNFCRIFLDCSIFDFFDSIVQIRLRRRFADARCARPVHLGNRTRRDDGFAGAGLLGRTLPHSVQHAYRPRLLQAMLDPGFGQRLALPLLADGDDLPLLGAIGLNLDGALSHVDINAFAISGAR
jgi:hypothetical protein